MSDSPKVIVTVAGYRACQDPTATHNLKIFMKYNEGTRLHRQVGDAYVWECVGSPEAVRDELACMYGHLKDITVRVSHGQ